MGEGPAARSRSDGCAAWTFVVPASFIVQFHLLGVFYSFGELVPAIAQELRVPVTDVVLAGSLVSAISFAFSPLVTFVHATVGFRQGMALGGLCISSSLLLTSLVESYGWLLVTHSALLGAGACLVFTPSIAILGKAFSRHLGAATAIVVSGSSAGTIVIGSFIGQSLEAGWRLTLRRLAALAGPAVCTATLFYGADREWLETTEHQLSRNVRTFLDGRAACLALGSVFWRLWAAITLAMLSCFAPYFTAPMIVETFAPGSDGDATSAATASVVAHMGLAGLVGRLVLTGACELVSPSLVLLCIAVFMPVTALTIPLAPSLDALTWVAMAFAFFANGIFGVIPVATADLLGADALPVALGSVWSGAAVGVLLGPAAVTAVAGATESWVAGFTAVSAPSLCGALLLAELLASDRLAGKRAPDVLLQGDQARSEDLGDPDLPGPGQKSARVGL